MIKLKKSVSIISIAAMLFADIGAYASKDSISDAWKQVPISCDGELLSEKGYYNEYYSYGLYPVFVPLRAVAEKFGAEVDYNTDNGLVTVCKNGAFAEFQSYMSDDLYLADVYTGVYYNFDKNDVKNKTNGLSSYCMSKDGVLYIDNNAISEILGRNAVVSDDLSVSIDSPPPSKGWLYYASWSDNGHMYRVDTNGDNRQLICSEDCYYITENDGYIYYFVRGENDKKLYRMNYDGTGVICVTPEGNLYNDYASVSIGFYEDKIIYNLKDNGLKVDGLYCVNNDGTNRVCLAEGASEYLSVYNGRVFYKKSTDEDWIDKVYSVNLDGTEEKCCTPDGAFSIPRVKILNGEAFVETHKDTENYFEINVYNECGELVYTDKGVDFFDTIKQIDMPDTLFRYYFDYNKRGYINAKKRGSADKYPIAIYNEEGSFAASGGKVYFAANNSIYETNSETLETRLLYSGENLAYVCGIDGNTLICADKGYELSEYDIETGRHSEWTGRIDTKPFERMGTLNSPVRIISRRGDVGFAEFTYSDGSKKYITNEDTRYHEYVSDR